MFRRKKTPARNVNEGEIPDEAAEHHDKALDLFSRYQKTRDLAVLHMALGHLRAAADATPVDRPVRVAYLSDLAIGLNELANATRSLEALTEAARVGLELVTVTPDGHPEQARRLFDLGQFFGDLFAATGELDDLRAAAEVGRAAVAATAGDDLDRAARLAWLWNVLYTLGRQADDPDVLLEAADVCREAVAATPNDIPNGVANLGNLAVTLGFLGERTKDAAVLRDAVSVGRAAVVASPDDDPRRTFILFNLATALRDLGRLTESLDELHESVAITRAIAASGPNGRSSQAERLANLWNSLYALWDVTGDLDSVQELIVLGREAVAATPEDEPGGRADRLTNLAMILRRLFEKTGDLDALREAADVSRAALAVAPQQDDDRFRRLTDLGLVLTRLYDRTRDLEVVAEAVGVFRAALAATPSDSASRASVLTNMGNALLRVHCRTGDLGALQESITIGRQAVAMTSDGEPSYAACLGNLAAALSAWFDATGDLDALGEAVAAGRASVAATPEDDPDLVPNAANLGLALQRMFERTGDLDALSSAVTLGRIALWNCPVGDPGRAARMADLGNGLLLMYERGGDKQKLREAIITFRAAVTLTPDAFDCQSGLSRALRRSYELTGEVDVLREAVAASRAAATVVPDDHPTMAAVLSNLGSILLELFKDVGEVDALSEARSVLAQANRSHAAPVSARLMAGRLQAEADTLAGDHASAMAVMRMMVDLLPLITSGELHRQDQEHLLSEAEVAGIGAQAAATALSAGLPEVAVSLLEQARGLLLAQAMGARGDDLAMLRERAPDLVTEFERLRDQRATETSSASRSDHGDRPPRDAFWPPSWPRTVLRSSSGTTGWHLEGEAAWYTPAPDAPALAGRRQETAYAWNELLTRIRSRAGLEGFLAPPPVAQLLEQATAGPVVIVNADLQRCDALVLGGDHRPAVTHVPLPDLTHATAVSQAVRWWNACQAALADDTPIAARRAAQRELHEVLSWLWDTTTAPILSALGYDDIPEPGKWPRLWWSPVGVMAHLPLHAAGHHDDLGRGTPNPRTVLDRVISSYTSTIRALGYSRRRTRPAPAAPQPTTALIVAMPDTPDAPTLSGVDEEVRSLSDLLPGAVVLQGTDANHNTVMRALPAHAVAHFACHGLSDRSDPGASRLLLQDHASHPLTVRVMSQSQLIDGELAYLSACSTTVTNPGLVDEAVHLTAAFQFAGYRHVIGTLWPVNDAAATRVAVEVYAHITDRGSHPPKGVHAAEALHTAIRRLRADYPATPTRWAAHLHTGA